MAKAEKSAHKSKREKSLQKTTKLEPTYKSAEFIDDSSSASEAPTPSKGKTAVGSTSRTAFTLSAKANLQYGSATKTEKHNERKESSDTRLVHSNGDRVEHEDAVQGGASRERERVNSLRSTTGDSAGSGEEKSLQPELQEKYSKSLGKHTLSSPNILRAEASPSGSSTDSGSEGDEVDVPPATTPNGKGDAVESYDKDNKIESRGGAASNEADSDAGSERDSSAEASESEDAASSGVEQSVSKAPSTPSARSQRPIPAYRAPPDFEPAAISLGDAPSAEKVFSTARLDGKELWHIVLPSSVPVSALKEIPAQGILNGLKFLSHDDSDYSLVRHGEAVARALLIPSHTDDLFTPVKTPFAKSLRLQQLVKVPTHAVNPALRPSSSEVPKKKRNQQPEGLRMRYQPFGIPDSSIVEPGADSDPSEQPVNPNQPKMAASQFKPPPETLVDKSTGQKEKKKKRKHGEIAPSAPVTPSSTQMKKQRRDHPGLGVTLPPKQSPTLASTPISGPDNSQPVMQAKSEGLITVTHASPMQLGQETFASPANASPAQTHRHRLQSSPPVTPARPRHDVSSSGNKGTNNNSHRKASKSAQVQRNKLLQPFHVPRSVSSTPAPAVSAKAPVANEDDPAPTNLQPSKETDKARRKRERKEEKRRTKLAREATNDSAPTLGTAEQATTTNDNNPAPTNSQLYYEGERARKKRQEEQRGDGANKPASTTTEGGEPAPGLSNEALPPPAENDDIAAARAKRKQEKQARKEERRRRKGMAAAAAGESAAGQ